jgi:hypothetical protein
MVRFVAYLLSSADKSEGEDYGLRFLSLIEFDAPDTDGADPVNDRGEDIANVAGGTAA